MVRLFRFFLFLLVVGIAPADAQDPGTLNPEPLPPLQDANSPKTPAKELFCPQNDAAARSSAIDWLVRRLSRRGDCIANHGIVLASHARVTQSLLGQSGFLVAFIERLADSGKKVGWNGLLIGDMSQPRGGPMLKGHSSHQIGLDVDIWFTPMPDHELSPEEREFNMALNMVAKDRLAVDPKVWTYERTPLVGAAAQDPVVTRIFVNPAIKKGMCHEAEASRFLAVQGPPMVGTRRAFPCAYRLSRRVLTVFQRQASLMRL